MKFTKMHGIGNDYVYVDCFEETVENPSEVAVKISDRHFGVGSDGLILIKPSKVADFEMAMYNADGSRGEMCGNGIRCVAKYVYDRGLTDKTSLSIETLAGIKYIDLTVENGKVSLVRVNMGAPELLADKIPVISDTKEVIAQPLLVDGKTYDVTCVSMGNPHCVLFLKDDVKNLNLDEIGPKFENAEIFPEKVNTEFVNVIDDKTLSMRVYERGSGETLACGTGACAVAVAAVLNGICKKNEDITVRLLGGSLKIKYTDETVFMTGPAKKVFEGEVEI